MNRVLVGVMSMMVAGVVCAAPPASAYQQEHGAQQQCGTVPEDYVGKHYAGAGYAFHFNSNGNLTGEAPLGVFEDSSYAVTVEGLTGKFTVWNFGVGQRFVYTFTSVFRGCDGSSTPGVLAPTATSQESGPFALVLGRLLA
ncbi:hypothetical protein [Amycolatopsis sp. NPDC058986]|uniref:hypothetical protein n=1 Tax=unclassified Amycolatopsis TaxID=2618356 RepID=UPI00366ED08D